MTSSREVRAHVWRCVRVWQRADHLMRMRMTHQDMKDEEKQAEGDPFP